MHTATDSQTQILKIGRSNPEGRHAKPFYLDGLDFSVVQQCIHCGMCLPTCPTYDTTKLERNSPRGRIALMRLVAEGQMEVTEAFGEEMYFCLGCLACETSCPAGVKYAELFENARADIEQAGVLKTVKRDFIRAATVKFIFTNPNMLRAIGYLMWIYQAGGMQSLVRGLKLTALLPKSIRELEPLTPEVKLPFSDGRIASVETPGERKFRVGMLTGCVQDLIYADVNRDTVDVLLANSCEVVTPRAQFCCGSLHAHNGELELSREMCRRNIAAMERTAGGSLDNLDAIVTNAAGCGSHLKNYAHLLHDDPEFSERAAKWSAKLKDVHEWLCEIGLRKPETGKPQRVTYHEACHLCHGQKITKQPREVLKAIPNLELVELPESTWCCGSAGIYNITQPEMSEKLLDRKLEQLDKTNAPILATANPGCMVQLECGVRESGRKTEVIHTISLLAKAYREGGES